jgi:hypothetical protein
MEYFFLLSLQPVYACVGCAPRAGPTQATTIVCFRVHILDRNEVEAKCMSWISQGRQYFSRAFVSHTTVHPTPLCSFSPSGSTLQCGLKQVLRVFVRWSIWLLCRKLSRPARMLFAVTWSHGSDVEAGAAVQPGALGTALGSRWW